MIWLKQCVGLTLPHEIIIADVVYSTVPLAFSQSLALLPAMVGCIKSKLRVLTKSFCHMKTLVDEEGNVLADQNGTAQSKMPNPRVELPYTYLVAWYVMHYPSLLTVVQVSKGFVPFVQRLERSSWNHSYMFFIRRIIQKGMNYQLAWCFPEIHEASYGDRFLDFAGSNGSTILSTGVFC